ncbi:hypothetical protein D3C84_240500 [compost metagenome]
MADTHFRVRGFQAGDDFFFHRLMGDQATQGGAALTGGADGAEQNRANGHVQIGAWAEDHRVVAAQFEDAAGETRGDFRRHFTAHAGAAGGADQRDTRIIDQGFAGIATANNHLAQVRWCIAEVLQHAIEQRLASQCGQWRLFRRFPDHRVAADQRQRGVPGPDRHREVERTDHPDNAQRMPGFAHVVARTLGGDGQAVQLTGQADGEVADVDHFLNFTQAFLGDLAGLPGHQLAEVGLVFPQDVTQLPHQLATARCRNLAPQFERMICATDVLLDFSSAFPVHGSNRAAIDRRMHRHFAVLVQGRVHTKTIKQCGNHGSLLKQKTECVRTLFRDRAGL